MDRYHPRGELAPRDVVARAIWRELSEGNQVFLDVTHLDGEWVRRRFPNIFRRCQDYGIDITQSPIPVAPAAHYTMGGVRTDHHGQTSIPGLYACGEVACNGVHGANRLASNSLLDGLVFGDRIVRRCLGEWKNTPFWERRHLAAAAAGDDREAEELLVAERPDGSRQQLFCCRGEAAAPAAGGLPPFAELCLKLRSTMWEEVGLVRSFQGLSRSRELFAWAEKVLTGRVGNGGEAEVLNMAQLDRLIAQSALVRTESRGAHYRQDFPSPDDSEWRKHLVWQRRFKER